MVAQKFLSHSHVQLSMEEEEERRKNKHHQQRQEQEEYDVSKIVIGIQKVTKW